MTPNLRSKIAWTVLGSALAVELVAGIILLIGMIPTFPPAGPERDALAPLWVSLLLSVIISIVWIAATLTGVVRSRQRWVRSSSVTLHVLIGAAAIGVFQGILGTPAIGALLLVLGLVGLVSAIFARSPQQPAEPEAA